MVNFQNIQEALNFPLGQIKGAKVEVTIGDYLDVIDSSNAFTRLLTQVSLYIQGKGWITQATAEEMIKSVDLETLNAITNICKKVITRLSEVNLMKKDSIGFKLSKVDEQTVLKGIKSLGDHHIDRSVQTVIQEMQLLRGWVGAERVNRHQHLVQLMGHWNVDHFEMIREDGKLKSIFLLFVNWANQWGFEHPPGTLGEAVKYLNNNQSNKHYIDGNFDMSTFDTSQLATRASILTLISGFKEWLAWSLETGKFNESKKQEIIDSLCKINPGNQDQIRKASADLPSSKD
ncbi:putative uncharacterized protein [Waddlia chondrophila 2032/99]|uniref:Uncharacterized protein n=2 Tax=Waddlia chondrophila TaxID=71667 RepID=D6YRR6_WADCW|nr:hypothetical protein [Waddlia chondrophila]ADI38761.1 hypothetical protein wcw_1411 [Waddlia chondrophila WSU 86-1044]CCB91114.1 putative uncharacterized protein [Waddlia chondrophila 2032/99]